MKLTLKSVLQKSTVCILLLSMFIQPISVIAETVLSQNTATAAQTVPVVDNAASNPMNGEQLASKTGITSSTVISNDPVEQLHNALDKINTVKLSTNQLLDDIAVAGSNTEPVTAPTLKDITVTAELKPIATTGVTVNFNQNVADKKAFETVKSINKELATDAIVELATEVKKGNSVSVNEIEPSYIMLLQDSYLPNDTLVPEQWYVQRMVELNKNAFASSKIVQSLPIVAVIDAGVDFSHSDLSAVKWQSNNCYNEKHMSVGSCNGGYDFVDNDTNPYPSDNASHGTAVASLIAASTDNENGIMSLSRGNATVMSLRVANNGVLETDTVVRAVLFAVHNGARIINMSFAGPSYSLAFENAIKYANEHGVMVITAAGNYGQNLDSVPIYPASYTVNNVVTVGASDETGSKTAE